MINNNKIGEIISIHIIMVESFLLLVEPSSSIILRLCYTVNDDAVQRG